MLRWLSRDEARMHPHSTLGASQRAWLMPSALIRKTLKSEVTRSS